MNVLLFPDFISAPQRGFATNHLFWIARTLSVFYIVINHKNYNYLACDWFNIVLLSTDSLAKFVIGQFVIGQFNKPITSKDVV